MRVGQESGRGWRHTERHSATQSRNQPAVSVLYHNVVHAATAVNAQHAAAHVVQRGRHKRLAGAQRAGTAVPAAASVTAGMATPRPPPAAARPLCATARTLWPHRQQRAGVVTHHRGAPQRRQQAIQHRVRLAWRLSEVAKRRRLAARNGPNAAAAVVLLVCLVQILVVLMPHGAKQQAGHLVFVVIVVIAVAVAVGSLPATVTGVCRRNL